MDNGKWDIGKTYQLGSKKFCESEIINFAKRFDPLEFHTDLTAAKKSKFKDLVCSGGQAFYYFYPKAWVPMFGDSVVAGMGLKEWHFHLPIYVNQTVYTQCTIKETHNRKNNNEIIVNWYFEFLDENSNLLQELTLIVLHKKEI